MPYSQPCQVPNVGQSGRRCYYQRRAPDPGSMYGASGLVRERYASSNSILPIPCSHCAADPPPRAGEVLESTESLEDDHVTCLGSMSETYQKEFAGYLGQFLSAPPFTIIYTISGMVSHPISENYKSDICYDITTDTTPDI